MVKARDIMTTDVISVKKDTSIYEAAELLLRKDITGMPVVEDDMTVAGVVTEQDMLKLFHSEGSGENKTVEHFMTWPPVYCEDEDRQGAREHESFDFLRYEYHPRRAKNRH